MRFSTSVGAYEIDSVPGNTQIAHCHGFFVHPNMRGQGHGHALKTHQMLSLVGLGYDFATCTIRKRNVAQRAVLEKAQWFVVSEFVNRKTNDEVEIWAWNVGEALRHDCSGDRP